MVLSRSFRGMSVLGTVIAFTLMAALLVVAVGATWKLTGPPGSSGGTVTAPVTGDPAAVARDPGLLTGAARGTVLNSHANSLAAELSAVSLAGSTDAAAVAAATAKFPVEEDGITITSDSTAFVVDRLVRLSDGSATVCVSVPENAAAQVTQCP